MGSAVDQGEMVRTGELSKGTAPLAPDLQRDIYGNPAYTIKDGGTLKRKPQPYAADRVARDGLNIDKERLA